MQPYHVTFSKEKTQDLEFEARGVLQSYGILRQGDAFVSSVLTLRCHNPNRTEHVTVFIEEGLGGLIGKEVSVMSKVMSPGDFQLPPIVLQLISYNGQGSPLSYNGQVKTFD